ncbi:glycoside hydrolase family 3 protein [Ruminococcus sp. AF41-9]|jgi:beta-glucosidase|nr:glycoside hydrolase family 3 protein [Ruminococcus sp. AF41-9]
MNREEAQQRARALVAKMTVEEKASQLKFDAEAIPRLGIPAYNWWNEALHGVARAGTATVFPQAIGLAAAFDTEMMKEIGSVIATEGRAKYNENQKYGDRDIYKGLTFWAPNVNIFRDPRWGRGHETYGEDPYLTSRLAVPFIQGLQSDGEYMKTAACAKHFAVHSGPEAKRHFFNAEASKKDMEETYLPAFEACVKEGKVEAVMGAYNRTNGEPCCASEELMNHYLRGKWKFQGHYVSDCWAIRDFHENHKVTDRPEESVKKALEAGCDLNCGCTYEKILNAYREGIIDEKYITESCVRLFTTRFLLGMFNETEYDKISYLEVESKEHLELAEQAATESMVLLKNDGILPLKKEEIHTIGIIGPNANSRNSLIGNYHGTSSEYVTVLEGMKQAAGDQIRVLYSEGCHLWKDTIEHLAAPGQPDRLAEAQAVAEYSDVVLMVVGLDETLEGEEGDTGNSDASGDKKDLEFPEPQKKLMDQILECKKPVILVNMTGSAMNLSVAEEKAAAIIQAWYPGARGGKAVSDVIFGEKSPSGKLPVTFYKDTSDIPDFEDYSMKNRTYRYYTGEPLYPFGYGLTYGKCVVNSVTAEKVYGQEKEFKGVKLFIETENQKNTETDDVLQVYIKDLDTEYAVLNPTLAAFKRIHLNGNVSGKTEIFVDKRAFTSVDENGNRKITGKNFKLYAGFSQPDARSEALAGVRCQEILCQI